MGTRHVRKSGVLLHLTSLPSPFGIGDMGPWAYKFADFLEDSGQGLWQVLPLNPTDLEYGNSPYHSASAFACNPLLISPELLVHDGFLHKADLSNPPLFPKEKVDFPAVVEYKRKLLHRAYEQFKVRKVPQEYQQFCLQNAHWLDDYALFTAIKASRNGEPWFQWPPELRDRRPDALGLARMGLSDRGGEERFLQFLFFRQWSGLKAYCNSKGIRLIGDIPIYVVYDSADVWLHPLFFNLDEEKKPLTVAGVPPDYFSETGQLWGNPVYRWEALKENGYAWWVERIRHNLGLFDLVRVDHFRGFLAYWEVPASEKTAVRGKWVQAPGRDFFRRLSEAISPLPVIAEDLGTITEDVWDAMEEFGFPGMKVLLFAFSGDAAANSYAPHNHVPHCVVYTGTHDNNTARGWYEKDGTQEEKASLVRYLGKEIAPQTVHWDLIRLAMMSVADRVVFPMQDILGLGEEARMNKPSKKAGNWQWRLSPESLTPHLSSRLCEMTRLYGRMSKREAF